MYDIKKITVKNGPHERMRLVIQFDDPDMQIVGEFLMIDAPMLGGEILEEIDQVLTGEKERLETSGNRTALTIQPVYTKIDDLFADMAGVESYPSYELATTTLRELTSMWLERLEEIEK